MALREPTYFVLAALLDGPLHGYAIATRVADLSDGRVRPTAGTLYGALERLRSEGLVEIEREEVVEGRKRRYHRLTGDGERVVRTEAARLRAAAEVVELRGVAARGRQRRPRPA